MSKKTQAIYAALDNLEKQNSSLLEISSNLQSKELENLHFDMKKELKDLRFWFESLYLYNGKSKSRAKKIASAENGKKGGRPLKKITVARRRIEELENEVIPDLESKIRLSVSSEEEQEFQAQLDSAKNELESCRETLSDWIGK